VGGEASLQKEEFRDKATHVTSLVWTCAHCHSWCIPLMGQIPSSHLKLGQISSGKLDLTYESASLIVPLLSPVLFPRWVKGWSSLCYPECSLFLLCPSPYTHTVLYGVFYPVPLCTGQALCPARLSHLQYLSGDIASCWHSVNASLV
jgi:hypothetical protein